MNSEKKLGLLGKDISYSFSKKYFEKKFKRNKITDYTYSIFDIQIIDEVEQILAKKDLLGFNVTIPYKEKIIPFLDTLSDEAQKVGAVNCVKIKNGEKKGYNTDVYGFRQTLSAHRKKHHQSALILGNGGAAKAVKYVLDSENIPFQTVARNAELNFENLTASLVSENLLIIQCTPVGTFPKIEDCLPFPFEGLSAQHLVIDLIYNPECTKMILKAAEKGAKTVNGLYMLEQQAEKAWEIWSF